MSETQVPREMTFGEKLVGLNFNPSGDDTVGLVKKSFADIADIINSKRCPSGEIVLHDILFQHTVGELLNAQMNVVKLLTLK